MKTLMSLDLKKKRIRLHKQTLQLLGNPEYIHFMVNPTKRLIAVVPCTESVQDAVKIHYGIGIDCELYSAALVRKLAELNCSMGSQNTYRLSGEASETDKIAIFDITDITAVESSSGTEGGPNT